MAKSGAESRKNCQRLVNIGSGRREGSLWRSGEGDKGRSSMSSDVLTKANARQLWLRAPRLDQPEPFGRGPGATERAVDQLGYVQIDTIHVIERSHHHVLFTRIPSYRRAHLHDAQSLAKSVFEYWTHALAYLPTRDYRVLIA